VDLAAPTRAQRLRGDSGAGFGRGRGRGDSGVALVEFAIVGTVLFTIVFGTIDLGRAYLTWTSVKNAAREGAAFAERYPLAQKNVGSCANPNNVEYRAQTERGAQDASYAVTVTPAANNGGCEVPSDHQSIIPGDQVKVRVSTTMTPLSPLVFFLTGGNVTIGADQSVVVQGQG